MPGEAESGTFRLQLILLALANVAPFRLLYAAAASDPPPAVRLLALTPLLRWMSAAIAGRMIAYS